MKGDQWHRLSGLLHLKQCSFQNTNLIPERDATWLLGRKCIQCVYSGQRVTLLLGNSEPRTLWDSAIFPRTVQHLNLEVIYFWNFAFNIFRLNLTRGNWSLRCVVTEPGDWLLNWTVYWKKKDLGVFLVSISVKRKRDLVFVYFTGEYGSPSNTNWCFPWSGPKHAVYLKFS